MRPKGSPEALEWRRQRAMELLDAGKAPAEVAEFLGVGRNTVYRWRRQYRKEGKSGLAARTIPGRPPRLNAEQKQVLLDCLAKGASMYGFPSDHWTQQRVARLIEEMFGISFCPFHVGRILSAHGWQFSRFVSSLSHPDAAVLTNSNA